MTSPDALHKGFSVPIADMGETIAQSPIVVESPSAEAEWTRVKSYFTDAPFYVGLDYMPSLPLPTQHPFPYYISRVMGRSRQPPSEAEFALLKQTFDDEVFDERAYDSGLQLLQQCIPTLEQQVLPVMSEHQATLGFYMPPHGYKVTLSRFGTTGSYRTQGQADEMQGEATVLFTGGEDSHILLERIVHEMVHIGLSQRLIKAGGFNHDHKESVIDGYVIAHFGHLFPDYERQGRNMLDRDKFRRLLQTVIYVAMLEGVELPAMPDGDANEISRFLGTYSTLCWGTHTQSRHRIDHERINSVLDEHDWHGWH